VPIILTAIRQVPEDGKIHICKDGNDKSINVNFGQATTEASLFLPYEQEQKVMEGQTYYNNVLCRQHEKGCSCCWSWGVFFFVALWPKLCHGFLIHEVSRSHTTMHLIR
jgi:hypothetical protein